MTEHVETVIIGGGQAGLALSWHLTQGNHEHVVLERGRTFERWRSERWDSLTLLGPNWSHGLPGYPYGGPDKDAFMTLPRVIDFLAAYPATFGPPLRTNVTVTCVDHTPAGRFRLDAADHAIEAANVVIATGPYQRPRLPAIASSLPPAMFQVHSRDYKNPAQLPPGAVLVVGSGTSGFQIAEELNGAGRRVFLSVSSHRRQPRRYRGQDSVYWAFESGLFDAIIPPGAPRGGSIAITGVNGGHDLDLRQFSADGVQLLGHLAGGGDGRLTFAADLATTLARAEDALRLFTQRVDEHIRTHGLSAPEDSAPVPPPPPPPERQLNELDLAERGIASIVWATGFQHDFDWLKVPVLTPSGEPAQVRGVSVCPGLYFLGLHQMYKPKSSLMIGVGEDAAFLAEQITAKGPRRRSALS